MFLILHFSQRIFHNVPPFQYFIEQLKITWRRREGLFQKQATFPQSGLSRFPLKYFLNTTMDDNAQILTHFEDVKYLQYTSKYFFVWINVREKVVTTPFRGKMAEILNIPIFHKKYFTQCCAKTNVHICTGNKTQCNAVLMESPYFESLNYMSISTYLRKLWLILITLNTSLDFIICDHSFYICILMLRVNVSPRFYLIHMTSYYLTYK